MRYLKGVVTLSYNADKCIGCERCTEVCPHGVFEMEGGKSRITDRDQCMECGACALNCPFGALNVSAGTGCAAAIIKGWITGGEPSCDCDKDDCC